jgi:starch phosphorylase
MSGGPAHARAPGRTGPDAGSLISGIRHHLCYTLAKDGHSATPYDYYRALVYTLRDRLVEGWLRTQQHYHNVDVKRVYYLSAEFLIGRLFDNVLVNLDVDGPCREALGAFGLDLDEIREQECDAGLGTGGLGRLAACYMDSMATLGLPCHGYGIRYHYGTFRQQIAGGYQVEEPDDWLRQGSAWEIVRPDSLFPVSFYGEVQEYPDLQGRTVRRWANAEVIVAMALDVLVPGYASETVNTFRLWTAKSLQELDLHQFNRGDYTRAVEQKDRTENITRVLYPKDDVAPGRELRLKQEYFLVSASLQDIIRRYRKHHPTFDAFADKVAIHLNDTHAVLAIPELMRLLIDREGLGWDQAWSLAVRTFGYTNHTILPEAMERWPLDLFGRLLPRHLQIVYEINERFLDEVGRRHPADGDRVRRVSLIEEEGGRQVRMAHLAVVGSHAVNGVSALHTDILRREIFADFNELFPERFSNKTNGITPRLWLKKANPGLAELITRHIGAGWVTDLMQLAKIAPLAADAGFRSEWDQVKRDNKARLARYLAEAHGFAADPGTLFDCQVKRIHEYKRQLLSVLHVVSLYNRLKDGAAPDFFPRTVFYAGKAAPGYFLAKLIIKLIHAVADVVNADPAVNGRLRVFFLPDYGVSLAERVIPAADLSEQISTAGTEASGTGNMKLALNGALTIGTLDGANIEIRDAVGAENFFAFGHTAAEIDLLRRAGYDPWRVYHGRPDVRRALDMIRDGSFSPEERGLFQPIYDALLPQGDRYFVLADFESYAACQEQVGTLFRDRASWVRKAIATVARMGPFSCDRAVLEYARDIWGVEPAPPPAERSTPVAVAHRSQEPAPPHWSRAPAEVPPAGRSAPRSVGDL